ncbi:MAG: protein kinase domain-containing protein [Acidimicrobiales bacterium]
MTDTSDRSDSSEGPRPGQALVSRYRFEVPVASGGMAQVWRGTDLVLGRTVAIKLLHPHLAGDPSFVERFRREAQAAARLNDPHIVAIFDSVTDGGRSALILQYVDGTTLRDRLRQGPMEAFVAAGICAQVATALEVAHAAGIVHRDVKPGNVLLCQPDTTEEAASPVPRVRVTDFGIAKALEDNTDLDLTNANTVIGTAKYLAPEQVEGGPVDARTDLFAVGVMLYEAVTGRPPWQGDSDLATALGRLTTEAPAILELRPDVDPELDRIITRAIARRPEDRFQRAADLRQALEAWTQSSAIRLTPPVPVTPAPSQLPVTTAGTPDATAQLNEPTAVLEHGRSGSRGKWRARAAAVLAVAGVFAGLAAWAGGNGSPPSGPLPEQPDSGSTTTGDQINGDPLTLRPALSYDFYGGDGENDDLLRFAVDGVRGPAETAEVWRSQCYRDDPLPKRGFGLILEPSGPVRLGDVELITRNPGWRAEIFVTQSDAASLKTQPLESWGPVRARIQADTATASASLNGIEGRAVLVFFTSLAGVPAQDCFGTGLPYRLDVIEAALYGAT